MSLNVSKIQSSLYRDNNHERSEKKNAVSSDTVSFASKKTVVDKSSDGKFSLSQASKNFAKGLISPITGLFSSGKAFLTGVGMIAGSVALIAATGGAAAPVLVAAGLGMGVFQAGKAAVKIAKAKDGDDIEKAFFDVGGATSTIGLSLVGAKGSLKQAGISADDLGVLGAAKKCVTSSKDLSVQSYNVFKTGYYKTNLANVKNTILQPKMFKKAVKELHEEGVKYGDECEVLLRNLLPEELRPSLKFRVKSRISSYEKIVKEYTSGIENRVNKIESDPHLTPAQKSAGMEQAFEIKNKIKTDIEFAKSQVGDFYGARLTLDKMPPRTAFKLFRALKKASDKGEIEILEIENYRGSTSRPGALQNEFYISEKFMARLREEFPAAKDIVAKGRDSGYTAVHVKLRLSNGKTVELQARGAHVDKVGDWEHLPYDLKMNKDVAKGNNSAGIVLSKYKKIINSMTEEQHALYAKYVYDNYIYAQAKEFGKSLPEPVFPKELNPLLQSENLYKLYKSTEHFAPKEVINPYDLSSQAGFIAGVESQYTLN